MRLINLIPLKEMENPCWKGYEMVGTKKKDGREVPNCVPVKETVVSEATGREAKEIARLTGTRDSIVQKFIDDFNLNAKNLFNFIAKGKEKVRKDFAAAMSGRPGNKYQGDFVGMFGESIVNEACWEGYKQVGGKMKNGRMVPNCVPIKENHIDTDYDELDVEPEEIEDFITTQKNDYILFFDNLDIGQGDEQEQEQEEIMTEEELQ